MGMRGWFGASRGVRWLSLVATALVAVGLSAGSAGAFAIKVVDTDGVPVPGFRYLVERDNSNQRPPGVPSTTSISLNIHKSYAPVLDAGHTAGSQANVRLPADGRYFVSVLPDAGYTMSGTTRAPGQGIVTVTVHSQPIPTAQITVLAFVDQNPINNGPDTAELGLGGATVVIAEAGGAAAFDAFGNPLGTRYLRTCDAAGENPGTGTDVCLDGDGAPVVDVPGSGVITTLTQDEFDGGPATNPFGLRVGEAVIKNLPMGKFGIIVVPPHVDDADAAVTWSQTTTIEGTPVIDAWVKANEPNVFVEGFGTGFKHVAFGYVKTSPGTQTIGGLDYPALPWNDGAAPGGTTIEGTLRWNHFAKPPFNQGFFPGEPVPECWVGLTDPAAAATPADPAGLIALSCDADSHFVIDGVPDGTYNLVWWDGPLDGLFGFASVTVAGGVPVDLGDILAFRWFGTLKGKVFYDEDEDGYRDPTETLAFPEQNVNLRFRDGTVYQSQPTDSSGEYAFTEVFPFFKWLVVEVDFARYKATGMTAAVDGGGAIPPLGPGQYEWEMPSFEALNPQPQARVNRNTGNNLSRTERGPVLTEAMHLFLNQTNVIDWGKTLYGPGENGGISGVVFYDTTRAEDDPAFNGGEPWQPGVPDVQLALYQDDETNANGERVPDGKIDDVDGDGRVRRADVDNAPFGWAGGGRKGPEDLDRNRNGVWDPGDAVSVTWTDSWDRNRPEFCVQNLPLIHGVLAGMCADAYSTWNQVRPGLFDGGYAFNEYVPGGIVSGRSPRPLRRGTYLVEVAPPPGYEIGKEEDKNVDFGDEYVPGELLLPPPCVGAPHLVPDALTLFPGVEPLFAGQVRPLCDRKQVEVTRGTNSAADFFIFTFVPKAARAFGFTNNDLSAEFNMGSPNFGEKLSPSWIPISFRDWTGKEVVRVYTDEYGHYNTLVPSTFTMNAPAPSGVAPNMLTVVLNDPYLSDGSLDPFHNPSYSVTPWTFQYYPGTTSYLDTPLVPLAAFAAHGGGIDTESQHLTPEIGAVTGPEPLGGALVCNDLRAGAARQVTIDSRHKTLIINPNYDPNDPASPYILERRFGFGATEGTVTLDGVPLPVVSWHWEQVVVTVPDAVTTSGRLLVTRASGAVSEVGVRLSILDCSTEQVLHVPGDFAAIQDAIDDAGTSPGAHIFVAPGSYRENIIMNKPVLLQGSGAGNTFVNGDPNPVERLQLWHQKLRGLGADFFLGATGRQPFMENEAPALLVVGETAVGGDTFNPGFDFALLPQARIDNFRIGGSKAGGGVHLAVGAHGVVVANNVITNNQGSYGGGVVVGAQDLALGWRNLGVAIRDNKIHRNGGIQGAGGIALYGGADDYAVAGNLILGNFGRFNGGGISHTGLCGGANVVSGNRIGFNESFFGAFLANAGDGGGMFLGNDPGEVGGTGSVAIDGNVFQGNLAGAGRGGAIRAAGVNAQDVLDSADPADWNRLTITNNVIVNNVAGLSGAGISLQDVVLAEIVNNTIANNDTTATSALAFQAGQADSTPQPSGVVAHAHSAALLAGLAAATGSGYETQAFSDATLVNNVIRNNRSFFNDASLNGGAGGLAPNPALPAWDLQVVGAAGQLTPQNCLLTNLSDASGDYSAPADANVTGLPSFVAEYENQLQSATVIDEGGNAITVRYTPLLPSTANYHLNPNSPAVDAGQDGGLALDIDGDARPAGLQDDIGADEYVAGTFTAVQVLTPNGGERIPSGSTYTITWGAPAGADHYTVEDSSNGGTTWRTLATGVTDTFLSWTVPTPASNRTDHLVRVRAFDAGDLLLGEDTSNGTFTIEVVRLLQPNGAAVLLGGGMATVSWLTNGTSAPVTAVVIERSFDGGASWRSITTVPGNPGSYQWAVPSPPKVRDSVLVRVTLYAGTTAVGADESDGTFFIRPGLVP